MVKILATGNPEELAEHWAAVTTEFESKIATLIGQLQHAHKHSDKQKIQIGIKNVFKKQTDHM